MTSGPESESTGPVPDDHVVVLFGATGDLARRKLLPGLFHLAKAGLLPARYRIVGSAPSQAAFSDDDFRKRAREATAEFGRSKPEGPEWQEFEEALTFGTADPDDPEPLLSAVRKAEHAVGGKPRRLFHLAVPPTAFASVIEMLGATGLAENARVIVEKPFGTDLPSAQALNATIHSVFDESRIFRIDHFLGKESVDNILALRFANGLFEPVWNRDHISHVQIDVPEKIGIEGRAQFFEGTGTFRDMIVTHLFQLMGFMAMEPRPNSRRSRCGTRRKRSSSPCGTWTRHRSSVASTRGIATSRASIPGRTPRRSSRCASNSTTGGGPVCPSSCVRASRSEMEGTS